MGPKGPNLNLVVEEWNNTTQGKLAAVGSAALNSLSLVVGHATGQTTFTPPRRTLCRPVYTEGDAPIDTSSKFTPDPSLLMPQTEFESEIVSDASYLRMISFLLGTKHCLEDHVLSKEPAKSRPRAKTVLQGHGGCLAVIADQYDGLWMLNSSTEVMSLTAMELFGFNVGGFVQKPAG